MLLKSDCQSLTPRNGGSQMSDNRKQRGKEDGHRTGKAISILQEEEAAARETGEEELPSSKTTL